MSTTVFMKLLESAPDRYDRGIKILTWGNHLKIIREIVTQFILENDRVLDIGVGTATLAILCAKKGAQVTGFDISPKILKVAQQKVEAENLTDKIELQEMSIVEMDTHLPDKSYNKVMVILVFSELTEDEQRFTLNQCHRVLNTGGLLIIGDEVQPVSRLKKLAYYLLRVPLTLITYLVAQVTTRPLKNIDQKLTETQFKIKSVSKYFLDSLALIVATKEA
ncbi:MAG: corrinoid protein-associated methyltransferase CpaM [Candidatus Hodarchaeota archaeon]